MRTNIEIEFKNDVREKKNIAHSASKRVGLRKGCKLPSDYMTKKQKEKLNGEVVSMNMNKPMKYSEFKKMSFDLQIEYMRNLIDIHGGSITSIAEMMGVSKTGLASYIKRHELDKSINIPTRGSRSAERETKWNEFLFGGKWELSSKNAPESLEKSVETANSIPEGMVTEQKKMPSQEEHEATVMSVEEWMDKPMSYSAFKTYGKTKQEAYLNRLVLRYDGSVKRIAEMFNIPKGEFYKYLNKRNIEINELQSENNKKPIDNWLCFLEGIRPSEAIEKQQKAADKAFDIWMDKIEEQKQDIKENAVKEEPAVINNAKLVFGIKGESSIKDIIDFIKKCGLPFKGTVTVEITV